MARTGCFFATLIVASATLAAFEQTLDPARLAEAIDIGQSRIDNVRTRFHAAYHIDISKAPVDYVEIVTPFRHVALEAEAHARAGARLYGQREALATLGDDPGRLDLIVELTFHPLNTYVGVPAYMVTLRPLVEGTAIEPRQVSRLPRFGPRMAGMPLPFPYVVGQPGTGTSQPLLGGRLVADFDSRGLAPRGTYWVVIGDADKELARGRVDFGNLR